MCMCEDYIRGTVSVIMNYEHLCVCACACACVCVCLLVKHLKQYGVSVFYSDQTAAGGWFGMLTNSDTLHLARCNCEDNVSVGRTATASPPSDCSVSPLTLLLQRLKHPSQQQALREIFYQPMQLFSASAPCSAAWFMGYYGAVWRILPREADVDKNTFLYLLS